MAYDEKLAVRIRRAIGGNHGVSERKMFGGLCFLIRGNMACGVVGEELMVRVGPDGYDAALARKHARPMDFTGRPMKGMVYVAREGLRSSTALSGWVARGVDFARTFPPK